MFMITTANANTDPLLRPRRIIDSNMEKKDLKRDNFKRQDLKGLGDRYYFSFKDRGLGIEICLEPCLNGFDVGLYKHEELVNKKECTDLNENIFALEEKNFTKKDIKENEKLGGNLEELELRHGTLERSSVVWEKALKIASRIYRKERNIARLKEWEILKDKSPDEEESNRYNRYKRWKNPTQPVFPPFTPTPFMGKTQPCDYTAKASSQKDGSTKVLDQSKPEAKAISPDKEKILKIYGRYFKFRRK